MKYVVGFFRFWYDFLVGDSWTLAVGGIAVILLGYGLAQADATTAAEIVLPLAAIATIFASLPGFLRR